jgi:hypothetical protein
MTIGAALLLIAAGAILRFAITTVTTHGVDLHTIGDILMVVGVVGLVLWLVVWAPWARGRRYPRRPPADRYDERPPADRYAERPPPDERRPPGAYQASERPPYPPDDRTEEYYRR